MDSTIAAVLMLDGIGNGAVYALLGMAIVLVFAVTRVILIPQGEFVAYGALTLAMLQLGRVPGTVWLALLMAALAALRELWDGWRAARRAEYEDLVIAFGPRERNEANDRLLDELVHREITTTLVELRFAEERQTTREGTDDD